MRFKRYMFLTLMLFLTIFSISFVCANENLTYEQNAGELSSLSDLNPIDAVNENVDFIDEANDDSLAQTSGNENNDLVNNESHLLRSSNDVENEKSVEKLGAANTLDILGASNDENGLEILGAGNDLTILGASNDENGLEILGAGNDLTILGASNDEPVLGDTINFYGGSIEQIFDAIVNADPGDIIYLNGQTYRGGYWRAPVQNHKVISNVKVLGGSADNPNQIATFEVNSDASVFSFAGAQRDGEYISDNGYDFVDVTFENLRSTGRMFYFQSGSLTNVVFNNIETYQHLFLLYGCDADNVPITLTNVNFTNCRQIFAGDGGINDGSGQLGAIFGAKLVGCNFINTSSANHGGAFCLSDEYGGGTVASSLIDCNFINITSRWFAVYIHGNYTTDGYISVPQVLDNCKFINCTGTAEYGGALGISHNNVIIRNSEFINNTGGEGAAIMVGGIEYGHNAFWGNNTEGNNMIIENCTFINNVAKIEGQEAPYVQNISKTSYPTGRAGAVYVYGNNTKIINTVFENNTASDDGGAIYIEGWYTIIENSTLYDNSAINGTIFIEGSNTRITNSNLFNNNAINGAGIYVIGENTYIANSEFTNNTADPNVGLGGAIDVIGNNCTLLTVTCNNNSANCGGAAFIRGNRTTIRDSTFDDNSATLRGGGLDVYGDMCTVDNVEVSDNFAGTDGGAVYVVGNNATFTGVTSVNNTATRGGSTFIKGDNIYVTNCTLDGNKALSNGTDGSGRGGGLDLAGTNCHVYDIDVSNNYADNEGGAIYIKSDNLDIFDIISIDNSANLGGSTFIEGDNIVLHDCAFDGNNATLRGGGLNILGENCTVYNVEVSDNTAGSEGGAVYVRGNDATFRNVTSINNTAARGGSTFIIGDNAEVHNCTLDNNQALYNGTAGSGRGGGIDIAGKECKVYDLEVSNNHADREGGAIYIKSSNLKIYEIDSLNNTAQRGGSVFIEGDNITVSDSTFSNNKAIFNESDPDNSGIGGAIDVLGNDCKFFNVTSLNNTAYLGGSTFVRGDNTLIQDCILDNNTATLRGGGLNVAGDSCTVENVEVSNNKAGLMGGAIYVNSNGTTLTNIIADNNTAERGGAAFINGTNIIVKGGELNNNIAIFNESNPDASGLGGAFDIVGDKIIVDGVHTNNNSAYRGGSSFIRGDNVTVQNCNLDNNSATLRGGGINIAGDDCNIENVSVSNNRAGLMGGGIYVNSKGTTLTNITADNNAAERGGAAFINGTSVTVRGGELNNNKAIFNASKPNESGLGGAFDIVGNNILFDDVISNNNTAYLGGAAFIRGSNVTVQNSNLDNNSATLRGGALDIGGGEGSQIINVSASNNKAGTKGGAVYVNGNKALFDNVTSIHNTAQEGGSSYIEGNETTVRNCNLDNNFATENGGGLAVSGHNGTFENIALSNCNAFVYGGAVYVIGDNNTFNNVTSIHNTADYGGSSYIAGDNTVVENCNLDNNIATVDGGGLYVKGNDCNFTNVKLSNCIADGEGGAVYISGDFASFDNVTSSNNTATYGGSTSVNGNNVTVKNSEFTDNEAEAGGAIYVSGNDGYFSDNNILSNTANMGGGIYITGDDCEFSQNNISYNDANFGGGLAVLGSNTLMDNNNITYNYASTSGGAVYVEGMMGDEITYFAYNNISSNHAEQVGGAIYSVDEDLYLDHIYAFNNTALKGGFADINNAPELVVANSTFDSNHALGDINDGYGMGGAFFISGIEDATIDGNFYNNTAEYGNGSAIYVEDSKLRVHDSNFFDNLALSYALPILPEKGTTYMVGEPINVTIWHIGGDNIANAIHNKDAQSNVTINNITYEFYNHGNRTIKTTSNTDEIPVIGFENSDDGEKIYLDDLEDNQPIYYTITKIGAGDYPDPSDITDISGSISFTLNGLPVGRYLIQANYDRTTYYTEILNQTWIRIIDVSSINVTKVWDDNDDFDHIRPSNVTVLLYNDTGLINQTVLSDENNWTYSFEGLLIYDEDGINLINYTIEEVPIDGYATVITNITGDHSVNLTITNIHIPLTSVNVTKIWNDGNNADNTRPDNITVVLLANGTAIDTAVLNAANNWTWSFTNLTIFNDTEKVVYTIGELTVDNYIVNITESPAGIFTIVNTLVTDINVTKIWHDGNNADNTRPEYITVELFGDGVSVANGTLNAANNWTYSFTNLTVFNGNDRINYTISEVTVENYIVNITDFVIDNTYVTSVNVTKIWNDGNNADNTRPEYITVELFGDGVSVANATLNAANNWTYSFTNLTVFNGTERIKYTIREINVTGYISVVTNSTLYNWTITNTELVNITVVKVWTDNEDQDGIRPRNVTVMLFADDSQVGEIILNETNNWTHTFEDLIKFRADGSLVEYRVNENEVRNYTAIITRDNNNFLINNTHIVELVNVTVVKVWTDNDNQDGVRPANVTVLLFADDVNIFRIVLNDANNWMLVRIIFIMLL